MHCLRVRLLTILVFVVAIAIHGQSPYNSALHGIILDRGAASSMGYGGAGLVSAHSSRFSVENPSSWANLTFTLLSVHYNTGEVLYGGSESTAGFGRLANASFIVPIRKKFALGLGIAPLSRKQFTLIDSSAASVIFAGDTLVMAKSLSGVGGISSFFTGGTWRLNETNSVGLKLDFLFGTFDDSTTALVPISYLAGYYHNEYPYYRRHSEYKGTLVSLYLTSSQRKGRLKSTFYLGLSLPVGASKVVRTDYFPYADSEKQSPEEFPLPVTVMGGLARHLTGNLHVGVEYQRRYFEEKGAGIRHQNDYVLNSLSGSFGEASRLSVGLLRERIPGSRDFFDLLHYRIGFFRRQHYIFRVENDLMESGLAVGLGIPFGLTQNQIDFGFRFSSRKGFLSDDPEIIRQFTVGLTIGDVWLVKRRRR